MTDVQPKRPPSHRWTISDLGITGPQGQRVTRGIVCTRGKVVVISTVDNAELPDGSGETGPQWHVSVAIEGGARRPTDAETQRALRDFDMADAEEDNHEPGRGRHFWMPVDPDRRVDCECKTTEVVHVEADGHRWSNPHDATPENCNGCRIARMGIGITCPLHS